MNLKHPKSVEFSQVLDKACGRMVELGLKLEAMVWLADELACMLSNESFEAQPAIPHTQALHRLTVQIACYLEGRWTSTESLIEALHADLSALPSEVHSKLLTKSTQALRRQPSR